MSRPSKDEYYLNIAREIAQRATCMRRRFGAVIVKDDQIISTGYVGAPRGSANCIDLGYCPRQKAGIPPGERYELCRSVHAEANAVVNAARAGVSTIGGKLYLHCENVDGSPLSVVDVCRMCKRMVINAGIVSVIIRTPEGGLRVVDVSQWVKDETDFSEHGIKGY